MLLPGSLGASFQDGRVSQISVQSNYPAKTLETAEKIKPGSTAQQVKKYYPNANKAFTKLSTIAVSTGYAPLIYWVDYESGIAFEFYTDSSRGRLVDRIHIFAPNGKILFEGACEDNKDLRGLPPFALKVPAKMIGQLLRALLLDEKGGWLRTVLREANDKLTEFRAAGHSDAAGLVIAIDQKHARKIAKLLKQITGDEATVVISEDPDSGRALHEFSREGSSRRWIVAVKMVSEGIDIPRLRVGVYASTTLTELAFRQAVGRFVRIIAGLGEQNAAFYMPAHPALVRYALAIKVERDHVLGFHSYPSRLSNQTTATGNGQPGSSGNSLDDSFLTGNSEPANSSSSFDENGMPVFNDSFTGSPATNVMLAGSGHNSGSVPFSRQILVTIKSEARFEQTIYDGKGFSDHELRMAEQHAGQCGLVAPPEQLAAFLRVAAGAAGGVSENSGVGNDNENQPDKHRAQSNAAAAADVGSIQPSSTRAVGAVGVKKSSAPIAEPPMLLFERKKLLRDLINKTENRLAGFSGKKPGNFHSVWAREMNEKPQGVASVADLERKLAWLNEQLDRVGRRQ